MPAALPDLAPADFGAELQALSPEVLPADTLDRLYGHYSELRRWSARMALIGPGTVREVLARHYGESLAALPWLPPRPGRLVDLGSGAGFPGLILAAARPDWSVVLVEARERKWAFLQAAARRAALSVRCVNARVAALLPPGIPEAYEAVTVRALSLPPNVLSAVGARMSPGGRFLAWAGVEDPVIPAGWTRRAEVALLGAQHRRLLVFEAP
jgi:16S rRNA (guanine527-N7)-methyltransferase